MIDRKDGKIIFRCDTDGCSNKVTRPDEEHLLKAWAMAHDSGWQSVRNPMAWPHGRAIAPTTPSKDENGEDKKPPPLWLYVCPVCDLKRAEG